MDRSGWQEAFLKIASEVIDQVAEFIPNLLSAALLLLAGLVAALLARAVAGRILELVLGKLRRVPLIGKSLAGTPLRASIVWLAETVTFWTTMLFFGAAAVESLELEAATNLVGRVAFYLPRILVGLLILFAAIVAGDAAGRAISRASARAGVAQGPLLARLGQFAVILLGAVLGADQLGIESTLLTVVVTSVFALTLGTAGIAFGLGSRSAVSNLIASHYLTKLYEVGQRIRIGDVEGRILEFNQTGVLLETPNGRALVPAQRFSEEPSLLITEGDL